MEPGLNFRQPGGLDFQNLKQMGNTAEASPDAIAQEVVDKGRNVRIGCISGTVGDSD